MLGNRVREWLDGLLHDKDELPGHMSVRENTAEIIQLPTVAANRRVEMVKKVRAAVEKKLTHLMAGVTVNAEEALFEEMRDLDEERALAVHFNVMRSLRTHQDQLRQEFSSQLNRSWLALLNRRDKQPVPDAPQDMVPMLKAYSDKHLNHYKILLEELRLRFSNLSHQQVSFHPLLPGNFYLCFWHATEAMDLTYQERKLMVTLFHRFVMDRFGQMAAIANQRLVDLDVPAEFEAS